MFTSEEMIKGTADVFISYIFPLVFAVFLWMKFCGTPGKRMLGLRLINEQTGENLDLGKSVIRYVGYIVSALALLIGFIWVVFDKKRKVGMTIWPARLSSLSSQQLLIIM